MKQAKTKKQVNHRKFATFEEISQFFEGPLKDAAVKLKMSLSLLKKLCREHGFERWPYRKIAYLRNQIKHLTLKREQSNQFTRACIDLEISRLESEIEAIKRNPNIISMENLLVFTNLVIDKPHLNKIEKKQTTPKTSKQKVTKVKTGRPSKHDIAALILHDMRNSVFEAREPNVPPVSI